MSNNFITRKSLGRTAVLGEYYNACKDEFTNDTIFKGKEIEVHTIEENLNNFSVIDDENECVFNRFNLLNVEQELKVKRICKLFNFLFLDQCFNGDYQATKIYRLLNLQIRCIE